MPKITDLGQLFSINFNLIQRDKNKKVIRIFSKKEKKKQKIKR
jgi:hypothetical protein